MLAIKKEHISENVSFQSSSVFYEATGDPACILR